MHIEGNYTELIEPGSNLMFHLTIFIDGAPTVDKTVAIDKEMYEESDNYLKLTYCKQARRYLAEFLIHAVLKEI